jgi:hypothetical protein
VTRSHLEFAIEAGEDFERDVNGAGPTEALNVISSRVRGDRFDPSFRIGGVELGCV